jgi:hypothetical protein
MQNLVPRRVNSLVHRKFFKINSTRFFLLAPASLLCFVASLYFAPALLSRRQSPPPPLAAALPIPPDATGEHSAADQLSTGVDVKAALGGVAETRIKESYGRLPIAFEENAGQHDRKVKYSARGSGFQLFLTSDEAVLSLSKPSTVEKKRDLVRQADREATETGHATQSGAVLRMKLVGANGRARVKGEARLAAQSNYFVGAKPENWHTGVALFEKVRYAEVYPGIDVVYYGNQRQLEYDFILAPHVNPARIKFKFDGARDLHLDAEGHLSIQTEGGYVRQEKPVIYQLVDGERQEIAGRYAINEGGEIGFEVGDYDRSQPLVIDPVLSYSTYIGGTGNDRAFGIVLDGQGNAYITGETNSTNFPAVNALYGGRFDTDHAFVLKLNPTGTALLYAAYLGGESFDSGYGIAVDAAGSAYVTGTTFSENFPVTLNALQSFKAGDDDGFVVKLNAAGNRLVYSSYLGGENPDAGYGIALDAAGNAYVTGDTESNTFMGVAMPKQGNPVYKSDDGGASWSARRSGLPDPNIAGLTVDPTNSSILYAAGQFSVFKSLNGGASWSVTGLHSSDSSISATSVVVDPSTPTTIYASAFGAVYKSTNGGTSWNPASVRMDVGGGSYRVGTVSCVTLDPNNSSTLYACAFDGVYKSVNSGTSWAKASGGFAQDIIRVNKIVIDPTNSQILYAATPSGIYKSTNGAATWATVNNGLLSTSGTTPSVASLAISPASPATIYAGTSVGLFKSTDGGLNWASANEGLRALLPNGDTFIPSISTIAISAAQATTIYVGSTQGGVFKSTDGGAHWAASNNGLANINVTGLAVDHTAAATLYASANSLSDGFVVKLDATGANLGYLRYLGGNEDDYGGYIAVDTSGNAYITGATRSTNFPTLNPAQAIGGDVFYDAYVTKLGSNGSTVYSTYLGGTGSDRAIGIAVNAAGNAYVTGSTTSTNFPTAGPRRTSHTFGTDVFVSKLGVSGSSLDYSVYHGGQSTEQGNAVALDAAGNAYVTGTTLSVNFPLTDSMQAGHAGGNEAFVLKLSPASDVVYSTFIGGSGNDHGFGIAVDNEESVYIVGSTNSANFPTVSPLQATHNGANDAFIAKITTPVATPKHSFQFSTNSYIVGEGAGHATVLVTRSGSSAMIAAPASLTLQTYDDPAAVPCDPTLKKPDGTDYPRGIAYARCDYATTVETVQFAAGETQKAVNIPIIDDVHVEGTETLLIRLSNAGGATLGNPSEANIVIHDNDTGTAENPTRTTSFFVRMHYLDFLSREPEPNEPWSRILNGCPNAFNLDPHSLSAGCDRLIVSQSFFGSQEFRLKGFFVYNFYRVAFDRRPEYAEVIPDMSAVSGATAAEVYAGRAALPVNFTARAEFKARYDALSDTTYVNALFDRYALSQVTTPDPQNPEGSDKVTLTRAELIARLSAGGTQRLTRAQVLRAIVESDEVGRAEYNGAFVAMQYYGYLRRTPEESGYQAWLRVINEDPNNVRIMVNGFVNSTEYRLRFGQP